MNFSTAEYLSFAASTITFCEGDKPIYTDLEQQALAGFASNVAAWYVAEGDDEVRDICAEQYNLHTSEIVKLSESNPRVRNAWVALTLRG